MVKIRIIVAYNSSYTISDKDGNIPWNIPEEMQYFKKTTLGYPIIMGRKTWLSLPKRPLEDRVNIVLSRSIKTPIKQDGVWWFGDLNEAVSIFGMFPVYIIGGGEIYQAALEHRLVHEVIASEIKGHLGVSPGATFPNLRSLGWQPKVLSKHEQFNVVRFSLSVAT